MVYGIWVNCLFQVKNVNLTKREIILNDVKNLVICCYSRRSHTCYLEQSEPLICNHQVHLNLLNEPSKQLLW